MGLDSAPCDEYRKTIGEELRGHVWDAMRCPHANHVLQKCITTLRPQALQFMIDEIEQRGVVKIAKHQYGCRILQRLWEHCRADQIQNLVENILLDAVSLCKHIYAHFVTQQILEHGSESHRHRLIAVLEQHVAELGSDKHASVLFSSALSYGCYEDQTTLLHAVLEQRGLIAAMS